MDKNIRGLQPEAVWGYFADICKIPRPSHHEEAIRDYLVKSAKSLGLECNVDSGNNVIIRKPATKGYENRQGIVLQVHADMVPQKNSDKSFDFKKDAIEAYIDGEWVKADGTTLGADNGMGMAAILALLASTDIAHGPLEALITATEETGMIGAFGLGAGELRGDILINLDSETEGELIIGCAGGLDANIELTYLPQSTPAGYACFEVEVKGLLGGHSGLEIVLGRGNANLILCRLLKQAERTLGARVSMIDGGGLRNTIPREAKAVVCVESSNAQKLRDMVLAVEQIVRTELKGVDDGLRINMADCPDAELVMDKDGQSKMLKAITSCPNGVMRMSSSMPGVVQTSTNLARVVSESGKVKIQCLLRSASNSEKDYFGDMISSVFELAGGEVELTGAYNGWDHDAESSILATTVAVYEELFGTKPHVSAIHAGLECGIIGSNYPKMDMISMGPTIKYPHSPDEKVNVASVGKFWKFLLHTLRSAPEK